MDIFSEKNKLLRYIRTYLPIWRKKRIGFCGNFGHGDLGDDAAFYVAQELLAESLMPISKRCYAFNPPSLKGILIGGRGVFHWSSPYVPRKFFNKKKWDFPVVLYGAGVNCDYDKEITPHSKELIKNICERCDYISVRDIATREFLNGLGIKNANILPDLELVVVPQKIEIPFNKNLTCVGITVTPHSAFNKEMFEKISGNFIKFVNYLTRNKYQVVFLPFEQSSADSNKEKQIIKGIIGNVMDKDRVFFLERNFSPGQMLFAITHLCDFMVCMRMHSMAFAANAGIPFLPVGFNQMHKAFLDMLSLSKYEISLFGDFSLDSLIQGFGTLKINQEYFKGTLRIKVSELQKDIFDRTEEIRKMFGENP